MTMPAPPPSVFVAGHRGMVGSALVRAAPPGAPLLTAPRGELDLCDPGAVDAWFAAHRPQRVVHAAGLVGGIQANLDRPADFLHDNALMHLTVLRSAWRHGVERLLYLGSSCIYPREAPQPMREEDLLTGPMEPSNEGYAIAKLAGVVACRAYRRQHGCRFIAALPTNLYGPHDNFDPRSSHVVAALLRKFHSARQRGEPGVTVWGSGRARREFLHVDDLASACWFLLEAYDDASPINVGFGSDVSIAELADAVRGVVYPEARVDFDATKPDGPPRKLVDSGRLRALGWRPSVTLEAGLRQTYAWCLQTGALGDA